MRKIFVFMLGMLICYCGYAKVNPGDMPPDDLGKTLDGTPVHLSDLRGKVVVISFWATWCHYCLQELPTLAGLQSEATQRGLPMQVIAVDYMEPREVFRKSAKWLQSRLPGLLLTWDRNGVLRRPYGSEGIPVMVMLHRDGSVARIDVGYDEANLDDRISEINALLNEPAPTPHPAVPAQTR